MTIREFPVASQSTSIGTGVPFLIVPNGAIVTGPASIVAGVAVGEECDGVALQYGDPGETVKTQLAGVVVEVQVSGLNGASEIHVGSRLRCNGAAFEPNETAGGNSGGFDNAVALEYVAGTATFPRYIQAMLLARGRRFVQGEG